MFSFQQFCEYVTCEQRYSTFSLTQEMLDRLTECEKNTVYVETRHIGATHICWYPRTKFFSDPCLDAEGIKLRMLQCLENNDFDGAAILKNRLKTK